MREKDTKKASKILAIKETERYYFRNYSGHLVIKLLILPIELVHFLGNLKKS